VAAHAFEFFTFNFYESKAIEKINLAQCIQQHLVCLEKLNPMLSLASFYVCCAWQ
jgi:hypothetical protein